MPEIDSIPSGISVHKRRAAARTLRPAAAGLHQTSSESLPRGLIRTKTTFQKSTPSDPARSSCSNNTRENNDAAKTGLISFYATARMTRATFSKISPISASLTINGGAIANVSPVMRMTKSSSWKARSMAS
jgi:hypothetical protein